MLLSTIEEKAVREFVSKISSECGGRVQQIKLFGSKARGASRKTSDIDILVVVDGDELELWDKIQEISSATSLMFNVFLSVKVMDATHLSLLHSLQTAFIRNIEREGIDLWKAA